MIHLASPQSWPAVEEKLGRTDNMYEHSDTTDDGDCGPSRGSILAEILSFKVSHMNYST